MTEITLSCPRKIKACQGLLIDFNPQFPGNTDSIECGLSQSELEHIIHYCAKTKLCAAAARMLESYAAYSQTKED